MSSQTGKQLKVCKTGNLSRVGDKVTATFSLFINVSQTVSFRTDIADLISCMLNLLKV